MATGEGGGEGGEPDGLEAGAEGLRVEEDGGVEEGAEAEEKRRAEETLE